MATFKIVSVGLSLLYLVHGEPPLQGYNYQSSYHSDNFNKPSDRFLPPKTALGLPSSYLPPNSFTNPGQFGQGSNQHHHQGHHHGNEAEIPKSYEFGYSVKDAQSGNDYDRRETSDGNVVRGEYRVHLPDGRTQIVTYHADWQTGFHAKVTYEGQARYPENTNKGYNYNTPQYTGNFNSNSNGNTYTPSTAYGPPGYH